MSSMLEFTYDREGTEKGTARLDIEVFNFLSASRPDLSRSQVKLWIEAGNVTVNGVLRAKAGTPLRYGDKITVLPLEATSSHLEASDFPLDIIYQDDDVVVINKPAGLSMHPGAGNRSHTLANALLGHLVKGVEFGGLPERPGIVHRLDKDTTGVVVVARTVAAHTHLSEQFRKRSVNRAYKALVLRTPRARRLIDQSESGTVDLNLDRDPSHRTRMAIVAEGGRRAVSHWQVIERMDYGALLDIKLETGRTHQIRVHMAAIQSPVIGDKVYGDFSALPAKLKTVSDKFGRQALHAYRLEFDHPVSAKRLSFISELPTDFEEVVGAYRSLKG